MNNGNLPIGEAAKYVGITVAWLRLLAEAGKIPCTRVAHGQHAWRYFAIKDLDALKAARARRQPA